MQGEFVADVAAYYGDAVPNFARPKHLRPGLGYGYDYSDLNTEVLLRAQVDDRGRLALPSGMSYAVLTLPEGDRRMNLEVLRHLERLVHAGATVIGARPEHTYGLRGHPEAEEELRALAARLWGEAETGPAGRQHGRGRVIAGRPALEVLLEQGIGPDFDVWPASLRGQIDFIHRRTAREDLYFVRNAATRAFSGLARYAKQFELSLDALPPGSPVILDLGEVREVARVFLNGREAGLATFPPHELEVTSLIRAGENSLAIEVANTWLNRLIADDALPEAQRKTHTNLTGPAGGQRWRDATPRPSGLLGPVRLRFLRESVVD